MFSMLALSSPDPSPLQALRQRDALSLREGVRSARTFQLPAVDEALFSSPSGGTSLAGGSLGAEGLPKGAIVELSAPRGLCRATTLALSACASAQREARWRAGDATEGAWCAWVDVSGTLHAGGAARLGVDLSKLLVVRPPLEIASRVATRVVTSRAFAVVVLDLASVPGAARGELRLDRWSTPVRRLALAAEGGDTTVLLLTDRYAARSTPLPVAMRLELEASGRSSRAPSAGAPSAGDALSIRIAKDRRGRVTSPHSFSLDPVA